MPARKRRLSPAARKGGMAKDSVPETDRDSSRRDQVVWGKTPGGTVFRVPTTHDVLTLFNPVYPKSHLDILNLALLGSQIVLYAYLPTHIARPFFLAYFIFWRAAYDAGLGWVLTKQSKRKWIVREVQRRAWLDGEKRPRMRAWIKSQLQGKMGKDYSFDELPLEYNAWLLFRQLVDIILLNDFVSYCLFAFACFRIPRGLSFVMHVMRWIAGLCLIAFNLWVKTEAHHVVKDYGWYWGDCFFQRGALVFDGVFEMAPHPMYSVGYAGYYGLSLIVGSYPVLFMSLAAHTAQFAFLVFFENPHIERMYGQKKFIAQRTPLIIPPQTTANGPSSIVRTSSAATKSATTSGTSSPIHRPTASRSTTLPISSAELSTPAVTEGDSESDSPLETETEDVYSAPSGLDTPAMAAANGALKTTESTSTLASTSGSTSLKTGGRANSVGLAPGSGAKRSKVLTQHDLMNMYFRKDTIGLFNLDLLRTSDLKLILLTIYVLFFTFIFPRITSSPRGSNALLLTHFAHALLWRFFHSFGLGLLLRAQSRSKFLVKHFITHYHYPNIAISEPGVHVRQQKQSLQQQVRRDDESNHASSEALRPSTSSGVAVLGRGHEAVKETFDNWKDLYNLSLCMTYASFVGLAWEAYDAGWLTGGSLARDGGDAEWWVGDGLLRHTMGAVLIALHVWTARECYEVLGVFGWFFGDFFIEDYPATLAYTGIYRFLNNPERTMCGAAFFGLALISGNKLVFTMAMISQMSHWWFLSRVENPHMQKLYGSSLRREAGLTKVIKKVAMKNALLLESRAQRHAPELKRVAKEVIGTFDKVYEETAEAVKELFPSPVHAAGAGFVGRVGGLTARFDLDDVVEGTKELLQQGREKLVFSRVTSTACMLDKTKYRIDVRPGNTFHVGEPIRVEWHAPTNHSIRDWIGIYRKGAPKSTEVTKVSSLGMWVPVHNDEWDGDTPLHLDKSEGAQSDVTGEVVFSGDKLPWAPGLYELRYHHDGKHNVLSIAKVEIYVESVTDLTFSNVRSTLMHLVPLALDSDPSLMPLSCQPPEHLSSSFTQPQDATKPALHLETSSASDSSTPSTPSSPTQSSTNIDTDPDTRDPDDFRFWSEKQAKRLAKTIQMVFDVEYSVEVIVADANLSALANRILVSKEILH